MNNWIKCSERQPEKDGRYLVTERWHSTGYWVGVSSVRNGKWDSAEVIAWQELPEAFEVTDE